jgi:hypothetical protein
LGWGFIVGFFFISSSISLSYFLLFPVPSPSFTSQIPRRRNAIFLFSHFPPQKPKKKKANRTNPSPPKISILWTAVFGTFGKLYINETPDPGDTATRRMKNAVWIDLVNMILWFLTTLLGAALFFKYRKTRSTYTGRATV